MLRKIHELDLIERGALLNSIKAAVRTKDQEVDRIEYTYEWYGFIHEQGAENVFGKGVNLPATGWRSDAIEAHKEELDKQFTQFYAALIIDEIDLASVTLKM